MADSIDAAEWRLIPDFPDYQVSDDGRVRRITPPRDGRKPSRPLPHELKQPLDADGYRQVGLSYPTGRKITKKVHRLVLLAFVGPPPDPGCYGAHGDGDTSNNRLGNLRWATPTENCADAKRHRTWARGEMLPASKLTAEIVKEIRAMDLSEWGAQKRLADQCGVTPSVICEVLSGKAWTHVK